MAVEAGPSVNVASASEFRVYVAGGTPNLGIDVIQVDELYPGFTQTNGKRSCREVIYTGGALAVRDRSGTVVVLPASMAGIPHAVQFRQILGSGDGTTATAAKVAW